MWPFSKRKTEAPTPPERRVLSFLTPGEVAAFGRLPADAVVGRVTGDGPLEQVEINPGFVALLHETIRETAARDPGFLAGAAKQGTGWLYIIDLRTPDGPQGRVPPEDIIGGLEIIDGGLSPDHYWANQAYLPVTANGMFQLPPIFTKALLDAVRAKAARGE